MFPYIKLIQLKYNYWIFTKLELYRCHIDLSSFNIEFQYTYRICICIYIYSMCIYGARMHLDVLLSAPVGPAFSVTSTEQMKPSTLPVAYRQTCSKLSSRKSNKFSQIKTDNTEAMSGEVSLLNTIFEMVRNP